MNLSDHTIAAIVGGLGGSIVDPGSHHEGYSLIPMRDSVDGQITGYVAVSKGEGSDTSSQVYYYDLDLNEVETAPAGEVSIEQSIYVGRWQYSLLGEIYTAIGIKTGNDVFRFYDSETLNPLSNPTLLSPVLSVAYQAVEALDPVLAVGAGLVSLVIELVAPPAVTLLAADYGTVNGIVVAPGFVRTIGDGLNLIGNDISLQAFGAAYWVVETVSLEIPS